MLLLASPPTTKFYIICEHFLMKAHQQIIFSIFNLETSEKLLAGTPTVAAMDFY